MRLILFYFMILLVSSHGYSQFEFPQKTLKISPVLPKNNDLPKSSSITYPSIFDKKDDYSKYNISLLRKKEETPPSIMLKEEFKNPGDKVVERMNKKDGEILPGYRSDQFLGEFRSNAKRVRILCRDHEYPDGDRVKILLNDKVIEYDIVLESEFKEIYVELKDGFNKIDFEALNQGTSGPNTAQFMVIDDKGNLVSSNKWNLTTGVKASIIVVKE